MLSGRKRGWEMLGVQKGFGGLLGEGNIVSLDAREVRGITHLGGTILGTTNRGNPFAWPVGDAGGELVEIDRSDEVVEAFRREGLDALIVVGGDGSLRIAHKLCQKGVPIVGVPKTIDNDVGGTLFTFGFHTAVRTATEAIDKVHSTAESHGRVMVVEVMGRYAGWIALHAGLAGTADVILIPEIPFDLDLIAAKIRRREEDGQHFSIVVVAEGACPKHGERSVKAEARAGGVERLGGIGERVAAMISEVTGKETRSVNLGHLQRGGSPTPSDRILSLRFGARAIRAVERGEFGCMVSYSPPNVETVPFIEAIGSPKTVALDGDSVQTARDMDICLGD